MSDGISMGTEGMNTSLLLGEVIADSIETVMGAEDMDGFAAAPRELRAQGIGSCRSQLCL